eukprot:maker-scaffold_35-snap-gene-1.51-mRNA-1 protein AED:0.00 eAED:0.00 QI:178/1/1/1/1/1/2/326/570
MHNPFLKFLTNRNRSRTSASNMKKEGTTSSGTKQKTSSADKEAANNRKFKTFPQPKFTRFENLHPFEPETHNVLYCMNKQDNVPQKMKIDNSEFIYYISQSRSPGHKDYGQDCMGTATHGNWEVHVLCDGHDRQGHFVALGVCQVLPRVILRLLTEVDEEEISRDVPEKLIHDAFDETARTVCWTMEGISVGMWVDVFEGVWANKPGYIKENATKGKVRVAIIDQHGYHLPSIDKSSLRRPRYTGGCTCLCFMKNIKTGVCKVAVSGDSRLMVYPSVHKDDNVFSELNCSLETRDILGNITPAHNVYNEKEKNRLETGFHGQYEFDGNFLVNPVTKFAIQPTRGFGDFDMHGTGYTHIPEISQSFKLSSNMILFASSDGVFDDHVWSDEEVLEAIATLAEKGMSASEIADQMYTETLHRSLEGNYVDDISMFCYKQPETVQTPELSKIRAPSVQHLDLSPQKEEENKQVKKKTKKKRETKDKRRTIGRGNDSFTALSASVSAKLGVNNLSDINPATPGPVEKDSAGRLLKSMAANKGVDDLAEKTPEELLEMKAKGNETETDDDSMPDAL